MDVSWLSKFFSWQLGVWATFCMVAVHYLRARNERLRDKSAEESGDWSRLRDEIARLDARCDHLQREVDECRQREAEWMRRAIAAESFSIGEGKALNEAQRIVSTEREIDAKKREDGDA